MMTIVFVTSTLKSSGPVNQLYSLARHLISDYKVIIISLSPEPIDTRVEDFVNLGVECKCLKLSRFKGIFKGRSSLTALLKEINPDIVHSQGLRPDMLMASIKGKFRWCLTIHNFPKIDYRMKFGRLRGTLMAYQHFKAISKCNHAIACSKSIANQFRAMGIDSYPIQNGVPIERFTDRRTLKKQDNYCIRFVVVGSLIERKNVKLIIKAFDRLRSVTDITMSLKIVGEGPKLRALKELAGEDVEFLGHISDVESVLSRCDIFISASYAEGLPYTVLEALCSGLPLILSSIEPHMEIASELDEGVFLFNDLEDENELAESMKAAIIALPSIKRDQLSQKGQFVFSDKAMANKYVKFYAMLGDVT